MIGERVTGPVGIDEKAENGITIVVTYPLTVIGTSSPDGRGADEDVGAPIVV